MIFTNEKEILKELKNINYPCYFIYGEDNYLIDNYAGLLIKNLKIDVDNGFNFQKYVSPDSLASIIDTIYTLPVFSDVKVVFISNLDLTIIPKEDFEEFKKIFLDYPKETILIVSNDLKIINTSGNKDLINLFDKDGVVFNIKTRTQSSVVSWMLSYLKKSGCEILKSDIIWIATQNSYSISKIKIDLDKLISFSKKGDISSDTIKLLVPPSVETSIFQLSKSINIGNYHQAITIIKDLKNQNEEPIIVFNTLYSYYNDILRAKSALNEGFLENDIKKDFQYKGREFLINNAVRDSRRISWSFLERAIESLFLADIQIKKSDTDPFYLLETLVTKLFLLRQENS